MPLLCCLKMKVPLLAMKLLYMCMFCQWRYSSYLYHIAGEYLKVPPGFKVGVDFGREGSLPTEISRDDTEGELGAVCMKVNLHVLLHIAEYSSFLAAEKHVVGLSDIITKGLALQWVSEDDAQPAVEKDNAEMEDQTEDLESSDEMEGLEITITKVCSAMC